jgi:hypothetical protein
MMMMMMMMLMIIIMYRDHQIEGPVKENLLSSSGSSDRPNSHPFLSSHISNHIGAMCKALGTSLTSPTPPPR